MYKQNFFQKFLQFLLKQKFVVKTRWELHQYEVGFFKYQLKYLTEFINGKTFVRTAEYGWYTVICGYWKCRVVVTEAMGTQVLVMTLEELSYKRTFCSTGDLAKDIQNPQQRGESGS